jgi:putative sigma-54 modulation protein
MEVEITARQVKVPQALREQAGEGMERLARILGKSASASIVFSAQKRMQIAEVTIKARLRTIVAEGKAATQDAALRLALEHAVSQVRRDRDRRIEGKRLPKEEKAPEAPPVTRSKAQAARLDEETEGEEEKPVRARKKVNAVLAINSSPAAKTFVEPHLVTSGEAIAPKAMTVEEAVKDAESRDRDLLIFRNLSGELFVLHRSRDGQMELIEIS